MANFFDTGDFRDLNKKDFQELINLLESDWKKERKELDNKWHWNIWFYREIDVKKFIDEPVRDNFEILMAQNLYDLPNFRKKISDLWI